MGKYKIVFKPEADRHLLRYKKSGNVIALKKIEKIIKELSEHPYTGTGQPEQLKYDLKGFWSRRINHGDRLIYSVSENTVTVIVVSAMGHYEDK